MSPGAAASVRTIAACVAVLAMTGLVGCTSAPPESPTRQPAGQSSPARPSASATPEPAPELIPGGTADDNLAYFDHVNAAFLAGGNPGGRAIIDNLVAAGFDKAAMELTADRTPLGSEVDSVQFAVQQGDDCLIGQADADGYTSTVAPTLGAGGCLVGNTRPIDW